MTCRSSDVIVLRIMEISIYTFTLLGIMENNKTCTTKYYDDMTVTNFRDQLSRHFPLSTKSEYLDVLFTGSEYEPSIGEYNIFGIKILLTVYMLAYYKAKKFRVKTL